MFCFWKLILPSIILCCSFFWIRKFCASSVMRVPNFKWLSCKVHLSPFEMLHSEVTILELERCGFLPFEVYLVPNSFLFLFFSILSRNISIFSRNFQKLYFLIFFLNGLDVRNINNKKLWSYQMKNLQCSFLKIATCEAFLINTKILSFSKKTRKLCIIKKSTNQNIFFHILHLSSKFQSSRFNNKKI